MSAITMNGMGEARTPASYFRFGLFWVFGLIILSVDLADGVLFLGDVDDRMRALQIRDLLADGQWFDRVLPFIAMPEPYVSPWSRLVDLPYAAITGALAPFFGLEKALSIAFFVWPPMLFAVFCALCLFIVDRIGTRRPGLVHLGAMVLAMTYAIWEFAPGRIDHHNIQLTAMMAMLAGFCWHGDGENQRRDFLGGALAGLAAVLSVAVGLECLPFLLVAFAFVALIALRGQETARRQMAAAGLAMMISAPLAGIVLIGPHAMSTIAMDAWSAPWIAAMTGSGVILSGFAVPAIFRLGIAKRTGIFGFAGMALIVGLVIAFPAFLQGPYAMVDDVARTFWLDRVAQEESAISFVADRSYGPLAILALCSFLLVATATHAVDQTKKGDWRFTLVWIIGFAAFALTLWQVRFIRFAPAFVPLLLPWLIIAWGEKPSAIARPLFAISAALPLSALALVMLVAPHRDREFDAVDLMTWDECKGADFAVLGSLEPARIIAPPGVSFPIAEAIVAGNSGHELSSLSFHRAAPGIARVATAFTSNVESARKQALAPFDYVAVCARETRFDLAGAPLYAALVAGGSWPGLTLIAGDETPGLRLYRIDHAALR